jgi:cysteine-rich repeat protein
MTRRIAGIWIAAAPIVACASAPIGDGFGGDEGVFSSTAMTSTTMTSGETDVDPSQGSMTTTAGTTVSSTDTDATDTETDPTDATDTETDPSMATLEESGPTTDDPSAESSSDGGDDGPMPFCGDGNVDPGEQCDDANQVDTDACRAGCVAATCGDGVVWQGMEVCDDGVNDGSYGGCNGGCASLGPYCGDASVQAQELCDPGVALPWQNVACGGACIYDFSALPQLYCNGSCTWAGVDSCDQAEADIYCKLVTGDPNSVATSFQVLIALDSPGFSCPGYGQNLGVLAPYGVNVNVWYQDTSILANHGGGQVIANATCS